jgi:UDP-N-acetyl-D-glucosamine dehydrogenase
MAFSPGPGIGGHCIPIDPLYLSWKLKSLNYTARFIELADSVNSRMPEHVVSLIADALNDDGRALNGASILILGVTYKPDTNDVRESPALDVIATLLEHKARVSYHDPFVARVAMEGIILQSEPLTAETLRAADCVVITANHTTLDWALVPAHARVVVDTRNALKGHTGPARIVRL